MDNYFRAEPESEQAQVDTEMSLYVDNQDRARQS